MTIIKRKILTVFFILLFIILAPIIVFYANGNIIIKGWNILATGGIFVRSMENGALLYIDNKLETKISYFNRNYLIKNLKPGNYTLLVKKVNYNDWSKEINVVANQVTEANVFMLPYKTTISEVKKNIESETLIGSTTQALRLNPIYSDISNLFSEKLVLKKNISIFSTTTKKEITYIYGSKENPINDGHLNIWRDGGDLFISWNGSVDSIPNYFCDVLVENTQCYEQIKIYSFESAIKNLDFYPGRQGVVIFSSGNGIYAIEVENNPLKKPQILYKGKNPDFRVYNSNTIYVKDDNYLGKIDI
jgi:hypothetical protein